MSNRPAARRHTQKHILFLAATAATAAIIAVNSSSVAQGGYALYNTRDLTGPDWSEQTALGIFGTQVIGYGAGTPTGGVQNGLLMAGWSNQLYRMLPAPGYMRSTAYATSGRRQVGSAVTFPGAGYNHAMLWDWSPAVSGGATQAFVNLHPAGYTASEALGVSGSQQVGTAEPASFVSHAALWNGTADSFVDLNPAGYNISFARSTDGSNQVGSAAGLPTGGKHHAMMWSGSAASFVDLHPAGFDSSQANFTAGGQQVGSASNGFSTHAALWTGSAASFVDLHPDNHLSSFVLATNGVQQVGAAQADFTAPMRAKLWSGWANSVLDLHSLVPGNPTDSVAQSIDVYGNISGYADTDFGQRHAVVWWAGDVWRGSYPWMSIDGWSGEQVPTAGRDILIIPTNPHGDAIGIPAGLPQFNKVVVDNAGGGSNLVVIDAGTTLSTSSSATAGLVGKGTFKNFGGVQQTPVLRLGERAEGHGTYQISDTRQLSVQTLIVGQGGTGVFQQGGGTVNVSSAVQVGFVQGGSGSYTLGSGTLNAAAAVLSIGMDGTGVFTQNGGAAALANVRLGSSASGNGLYHLTGGTVVADSIAVGGTLSTAAGTGRLNITGGQMTIAGTAKIWNTPDTAVNLNGGTLSVGILSIEANPSRFNWTGGTLEITNSLPVIGLNTALGTSVTLAAGKTLRIKQGSPLLRVDHSGTLSFTGGKLDLTTKKLISRTNPVGTWNGASYTGVSALVQSARNGGAWNGAGVTTSDTRAQNNGDLVTIGVAKVGDIKNVEDNQTVIFAGQHVVGADTVAMVTWGGDANLDGRINIDDYGRIDGNVASSGNVFGWFNGDFNYDGKINIDDYGIIDGNINRQAAAFGASAEVDGVSAVPEPGAAAALALIGAALIRRRIRKSPAPGGRGAC